MKYTVRINFQGNPVFEANGEFISEIASHGVAVYAESNPEFAAFYAEFKAGNIKPISTARKASY